MTDYDLIRRCDVLEILDYEGFLGRTRKLVEQLVAVTPEAQAAEIERLRSYLDRIEKASESFTNPEHSELTLSYAHESTRRLAREALTVSATVKDSLTTEDEKQSHEWKCPIDYPGCRKNCGSQYGCKN